MESIDVLLNNECRNELIRIGYFFDDNGNVYSKGEDIPPLTNLHETYGSFGPSGPYYELSLKNKLSEFELYNQYRSKIKL